MDLKFFSGMDRTTFERGLSPITTGYNPKKDDILIYDYQFGESNFNTFHIFTNFEDGTNSRGWGITYDVQAGRFYLKGGEAIYGVFIGNPYRIYYQYPNLKQNWLHPNRKSYVWKGGSKTQYLNWNENPFEVK